METIKDIAFWALIIIVGYHVAKYATKPLRRFVLRKLCRCGECAEKLMPRVFYMEEEHTVLTIFRCHNCGKTSHVTTGNKQEVP